MQRISLASLEHHFISQVLEMNCAQGCDSSRDDTLRYRKTVQVDDHDLEGLSPVIYLLDTAYQKCL